MKNIAVVAILVFGATITCVATPRIPCASAYPVCQPPKQAPEIDMGTIGTASALAGCILVMARGRRKT